MKIPALTLVATVVTGAFALPKSSSHTVHEKRSIGSQWSPREDVQVRPDSRLPMKIGLKQSNLHLGHDLLMSMSDPTSDKYGQHMSPQEVGCSSILKDVTDKPDRLLTSSRRPKNR